MTRKITKVAVALQLATFVFGILGAQASYQYGDQGNNVLAIQNKLIENGYRARPNSIYDKDTKWAVRLFQKDHSLTVDGIVGGETYKLLMGKTLPNESFSKSTITDSVVLANTIGSPVEVKRVLLLADRYKGVPYVFGGTNPRGFDCSGYIWYVFSQAGINLPRSADEQYAIGKSVSKKNLKPGDLVFFQTYTSGVSHSGLYIGNNQFISATSSRGVAIANIDDSYWGSRYIGAKRIM